MGNPWNGAINRAYKHSPQKPHGADIKEKRELFDTICGGDILSSAMTVSNLSDPHWDPSGFGLIFMESGESHFAFCCLFLSLTDSDSGRCPVVSSPLLARSYYCNKHQPFFPLNNPSRCTTLPFMNKSPRSPPGQAATHFYLWTQQGREPSQSEIQV